MIKSILILSLLILIASLILPWWIIVIISFLYLLIVQQRNIGSVLIITFVSGALVYGLYSLYVSSNVEQSPSVLMGDILGSVPSFAVYLITILLGGILSLLGGLTGYLLSKMIRHNEPSIQHQEH